VRWVRFYGWGQGRVGVRITTLTKPIFDLVQGHDGALVRCPVMNHTCSNNNGVIRPTSTGLADSKTLAVWLVCLTRSGRSSQSAPSRPFP